MASPPVVIGPHAPLTGAARRIRDRGLKRLPVINGSRQLIGIVCRAGALSVVAVRDWLSYPGKVS